MRKILFVLTLSLIALTVTVAQQPEKSKSSQPEGQSMGMMMPKPGPEIAKLDYFIGTWMGEETVNFPGMPPGIKSKSKIVTKRGMGGMFLVSDYAFTWGEGDMKGDMEAHFLWTYDAQKQSYRIWGFDSWGNATEMSGKWADDKTFVDEVSTEYGGQPVKMRDTYTLVSPTTCKLKSEMDMGQGWQTGMEGTYTKQGKTKKSK